VLAVAALGVVLVQSQAATRSEKVAVSIPIPANPTAMAVSPNGEYAYLVYLNSGSMAVVNLETHKVKEVHPAGANTQLTDVVVSPDGALLRITEIPHSRSPKFPRG
jgi:DNA-binding beta-propeller fold protein YncE